MGIVFAVALLARLACQWQIAQWPILTHPVGDAASYLSWAERIRDGQFWGDRPFYQAPLYPYFLAGVQSVIGSRLSDLRLVQAVMGAMSCVLLCIAGRRLVSPTTGLAAGLLLAIYPPAIFFDGLIQKTSLALLLLCALLAVLSALPAARRWPTLLAAGAMTGLLGLTRENALVLAAVILAWIWLGPLAAGRNRPAGRDEPAPRGWLNGPFGARVAGAVSFTVGLGLILLPVALRNLAVGGEFALTTVQMGPNFYIGNHAGATGRYVALQPGHESPPFERRDARRLAERAVGHPLSDKEVSRYWLGQSLDYITDQPVQWIMLLGTKWCLVWNAYEIPDVESYVVHRQWSSLLGGLGRVFHFGILCPLAVCGVILGWPYRRRLALIYALTLAMAASVALFYVFGRYRFPLVPLLIIPAAAGIVEIARHLRARTRTRTPRTHLALTAGAVALTAVAANWPINPEAELNAMAYSNLGTVLAGQGDIDGAIKLFRRAVEGHPGSAEAHYNLGLAAALTGDHSQAVRWFTRARQLNPNAVHVDYNLAVSLERTGQVDRAIEHYRRAMELDPTDDDARRAVDRLLPTGDRHDPD